MEDLGIYQDKRDALKDKYLNTNSETSQTDCIGTGGVDHLAMISSNIERTIDFYTSVLGMKVTRIVQNRDDPTSTHIFLNMGGGNLLAFFDFPEQDETPTIRGIGSMHHVALKGSANQYKTIIDKLISRNIEHSIYGNYQAGSVYFRDPDNILLEVRTEGN